MKKIMISFLVLILVLSFFPAVSLAEGSDIEFMGVGVPDGKYVVYDDWVSLCDEPQDGLGYLYYDSSAGKIIMHDMVVTDYAHYRFISIGRSLEIVLEGSSVFGSPDYPAGCFIYAGANYSGGDDAPVELTISGEGSVSVYSRYAEPIFVIGGPNATMRVSGGTVDITVVNHPAGVGNIENCIQVSDYVQTGGSISITSKTSETTGICTEGFSLSGGSLELDTLAGGITCSGEMIISGGKLGIVSQNDGISILGSGEISGGELNITGHDDMDIKVGSAGICLAGDTYLVLSGGSVIIGRGHDYGVADMIITDISATGGLKVSGGSHQICGGTFGIVLEGEAVFSGGTTRICSDPDDDDACAVLTYHGIRLTDGCVFLDPTHRAYGIMDDSDGQYPAQLPAFAMVASSTDSDYSGDFMWSVFNSKLDPDVSYEEALESIVRDTTVTQADPAPVTPVAPVNPNTALGGYGILFALLMLSAVMVLALGLLKRERS